MSRLALVAEDLVAAAQLAQLDGVLRSIGEGHGDSVRRCNAAS